jgi:hypothetical protein
MQEARWISDGTEDMLETDRLLVSSKYYCKLNNIVVRTALPGPPTLFDPADGCVRMHEDYNLQNTYTGVLQNQQPGCSGG